LKNTQAVLTLTKAHLEIKH